MRHLSLPFLPRKTGSCPELEVARWAVRLADPRSLPLSSPMLGKNVGTQFRLCGPGRTALKAEDVSHQNPGFTVVKTKSLGNDLASLSVMSFMYLFTNAFQATGYEHRISHRGGALSDNFSKEVRLHCIEATVHHLQPVWGSGDNSGGP